MNRLDKKFIRQYLGTALWSSIDYETDLPLDAEYSIDDIDLASIKRTIKDCLKFIEKAENLGLTDDWDYSTAGHDFWLTRNGHGTGFWDGDYMHGDELTDLSKEFGELNATVYHTRYEDGTFKVELF